ncbi:RAD14 [Candida jiufengensis]|uniref:RAD14 n=1 Tax=Candida jiufengensis TaxID=497108 RepID=UPI0022251932|nr:RAD14 [Candida jiufengensis]KAI5949357.1 RAD14 [Candida jiufengensis]
MSTTLSDEQKKRIVEQNRAKNLARLKKTRKHQNDNESPNLMKMKVPKKVADTTPKGVMSQLLTPSQTAFKSKFVQFNEDNSIKRSKTQEERNRVEQNRLRAIEIQQNKLREKEKPKNSATNFTDSSTPKQTTSLDDIRLNKNNSDFVFDSKKGKFQPPPIKKKDYIEYDFATMQDTKGGFINDETKPRHDEETLSEWKEKQKQLEKLKQSAPPIDIESAPKCYECGSLDIDLNLFSNFNKVRACRKCVKSMPEKYSLLVKTECKEDYLLTEPELQDLSILPRIEKPNPHGYSKMQLFLRFQVEEFAFKKWGSSEGLDLEWEKREQNKLKRKEKRYQDSLKEMRKKTRAEEFTRKLRDGKSLNYKHVHDWSAPLKIDDHTIKRRCIDCGIEIEEVVI